jgi:hypothetical protein
VYTSNTNDVGAIVGVRASENFGIVMGHMQWTNSCKPHDQLYVIDGTKGRVDGLDCLIVWGRVPTAQAFQSWMLGARDRLNGQGFQLPSQLLRMHHFVANDRGQFIETMVLTSVNFAGIDDGMPKGTLNNIRPRTARWADLMAEAARNSLYSLGGQYKFPNMTFAE